MLIIDGHEPCVGRRLSASCGRIVDVPKLDSCFLPLETIQERRNISPINYDSATMIKELECLYATGKIKKVDIGYDRNSENNQNQVSQKTKRYNQKN